MKLYHGSNIPIHEIDLKHGRRGKDFGQGFYLSDDQEQAHDYDIVYGPIADDKVGLQISRYQLQYIPMEELIRQLSFIRPTFQYFFGTERAIRLLKKMES